MPPKSKKKESAEAETSDPAPRATRSSARGKVPAAAPPAKPSASGTRKASSSTKSTSNAPNGIATSHTSTQPSKDMDDEGQSSMKAAGKGKRKKAPEENDASRKVKQRT
ncbi:hypothetical protein BD410DRAFT_430539 [Rickenella mellea]|uniref:Uncharacterized protein n=1 Tax=Rickenella mellea TaxID=50990 RepID=A0A4Y7QJ27_9AGAM|nr:hypothetical protein BD410DRAFT_430539 [Rickenella mellea]